MKVKNVKKAFTAQIVTDMHLDDFRIRLKQIRDHLDLDADNPDDQQRMTLSVEGQERLLQEVLQKIKNSASKQNK